MCGRKAQKRLSEEQRIILARAFENKHGSLKDTLKTMEEEQGCKMHYATLWRKLSGDSGVSEKDAAAFYRALDYDPKVSFLKELAGQELSEFTEVRDLGDSRSLDQQYIELFCGYTNALRRLYFRATSEQRVIIIGDLEGVIQKNSNHQTK